MDQPPGDRRVDSNVEVTTDHPERYLVLTWLVPAEVGRVEIAWTTAD